MPPAPKSQLVRWPVLRTRNTRGTPKNPTISIPSDLFRYPPPPPPPPRFYINIFGSCTGGGVHDALRVLVVFVILFVVVSSLEQKKSLPDFRLRAIIYKIQNFQFLGQLLEFKSLVGFSIHYLQNLIFLQKDLKISTLPKGSFVKNCKKLGSIIEGLKILAAAKKSRKKKLNVDFWSKKQKLDFFSCK